MIATIEKRFADAGLRLDTPRKLVGIIPYSTAKIGNGREKLMPGVFSRTLKNREANPIRLLAEHGDGGMGALALAAYPNGGLSLRETPRGLALEADIDSSDPDWQRIVPKIRRGVLRGLSFGFKA